MQIQPDEKTKVFKVNEYSVEDVKSLLPDRAPDVYYEPAKGVNVFKLTDQHPDAVGERLRYSKNLYESYVVFEERVYVFCGKLLTVDKYYEPKRSAWDVPTGPFNVAEGMIILVEL